MLILLPPSEGKSSPPGGPKVSLPKLSHPKLNATRRSVLAELVTVCRQDPDAAADILGLGPKGRDEVRRNARLRAQPCAPAIDIYSGVLYDALDFRSLSADQQAGGSDRILIASALWGFLRPDDLIPAYRLSGSVTLPELGSMRSIWKAPLSTILSREKGLIVDLRSGTYRDLAPAPKGSKNWTEIRVVTERDGKRITVSHDNKSTKGRIARVLLCAAQPPESSEELTDVLMRAGLRVEHPTPGLIDVVTV